MDQTSDITIGGTVAQGQWPVEKDWATKSQLQKGSFAMQQRDPFVHSKVRIWLLRKIQKEKLQPAGGKWFTIQLATLWLYSTIWQLVWNGSHKLNSFWTCSRSSMILHSLGQYAHDILPVIYWRHKQRSQDEASMRMDWRRRLCPQPRRCASDIMGMAWKK